MKSLSNISISLEGKTFQVQLEVDPQVVSHSWLNSVFGLVEGPSLSSLSSSSDSFKVFLPIEVGSQGKYVVSSDGDR